MRNRFQHEGRRIARFEPGQITSINDSQQAEVNTAGRDYPRTDVLNALPTSVYPGQQTAMLAGGDQDYPTQIGFLPYVL